MANDREREGLMVIVVDDDPAVRDSLKFSLELEGFHVVLYADGRELLNDPDLPADGCLVIDQVMPGMTGLETLDAVRRRGNLAPAILIVSNASTTVKNGAAARGMPVIEKPFFGSGLIDCIRDAFARR